MRILAGLLVLFAAASSGAELTPMIDQIVILDEQIQQWATNLGWPLEAMLRLLFAVLAGGLVGLEREVRGRQAGFRTNVLVCLGKPSTAALLGISDGIRKTRGRWFTYNTGVRQIRATATFHPAYLLRSPLEKRLAWRDFLAIRKALAN